VSVGHWRVLVAVVERGDLHASLHADERAAPAGCLDGRTISPDARLQPTLQVMLATGDAASLSSTRTALCWGLLA
jgi:hypothetical protein